VAIMTTCYKPLSSGSRPSKAPSGIRSIPKSPLAHAHRAGGFPLYRVGDCGLIFHFFQNKQKNFWKILDTATFILLGWSCWNNPTLRDRKLKMNKYVFRRLLVGVVITPLVAVCWFVMYVLLVGAGADPTGTPSEVWGQSLVVGGIVSLAFAIDAWGRY